jgi:hypothetical protein
MQQSTSEGGAFDVVRALPGRIVATALGSAGTFARRSVAVAPALVATLIIVFLTADAWKILGQGFDWQLAALLALLFAVSLGVLADFGRRDHHLASSQFEFLGLVASTPAQPLAEGLGRLMGTPPAVPLSAPIRFVRAVLYVGVVTLNLVVISCLVAAALVVVGVIRIDAALTGELAHHHAHVIARLPGHMVLTEELLSLSLSLGALAALFFAVGLGRAERAAFLKRAMRNLRRTMAAYVTYVAAREHEHDLTGISSRPAAAGEAR